MKNLFSNKTYKPQPFDWCQLIYWNNFLNSYDPIKGSFINQWTNFVKKNPTNDSQLIIYGSNECERLEWVFDDCKPMIVRIGFKGVKDAWHQVLMSKVEK